MPSRAASPPFALAQATQASRSPITCASGTFETTSLISLAIVAVRLRHRPGARTARARSPGSRAWRSAARRRRCARARRRSRETTSTDRQPALAGGHRAVGRQLEVAEPGSSPRRPSSPSLSVLIVCAATGSTAAAKPLPSAVRTKSRRLKSRRRGWRGLREHRRHAVRRMCGAPKARSGIRPDAICAAATDAATPPPLPRQSPHAVEQTPPCAARRRRRCAARAARRDRHRARTAFASRSASCAQGRYRRLDYLKETVRLGAGLDADGMLDRGGAAARARLPGALRAAPRRLRAARRCARWRRRRCARRATATPSCARARRARAADRGHLRARGSAPDLRRRGAPAAVGRAAPGGRHRRALDRDDPRPAAAAARGPSRSRSAASACR